MLDNPPLYSLQTEHARFAVSAVRALKYPADIAPFGAILDGSAQALRQLAGLLEPAETVYLTGELPAPVSQVLVGESFPVLQMTGPEGTLPECAAQEDDVSIVRLRAEDAQSMIELTSLVFPGYFRARTWEMGNYYGIRVDDELTAMAGERMATPGLCEISAVCTHPDHAGRGYAARLVQHLMREHAATDRASFLHVNPANARAISLYSRLGFQARKELIFYPVALAACTCARRQA